MDPFGSTDPKQMPRHFFPKVIHMDYASAIRADTSKQDYSVCPRHWYIDCDFRCAQCHKEFTWTAGEQKVWFEEYRFWVDSSPRLCRACKAREHHLDDLRREYDSAIASARDHGTAGEKRRIIEIVEELQMSISSLPPKMLNTRKLFVRQIAKCGDS